MSFYPYRRNPKLGTKIWRYLDFTKFVSLIDTKCLFFSRADLLGDPFEGSYPHADKANRESLSSDWNIDFSELVNNRKRVRKFTFINCWHASGIESDAMWRIYAKSQNAVAILSTYGRLRQCLPLDIEISLVKYVDYKSIGYPEPNSISLFFYKHRSFRHERELRAIFQERPSEEILKSVEHDSIAGKNIPVDLEKLIVRIYVAPNSPSWFFELVKSIAIKYGLRKEIIKSSLDEAPYF